MRGIVNAVWRFIAKEDAVAMAEYGLLLALIAVAVTTAVVAFRAEIVNAFTNAADRLKTGSNQ